ncbi:MarR family transcriptional regulator [Celerinatantimonas sp. MCCC 1A17872]|uniref:MarR family transcriptional regulator n=1 Tax=Celerinatantimonas sp. MCCC 1A17872 TaxID=3177514 RepID=UPI0038C816E0
MNKKQTVDLKLAEAARRVPEQLHLVRLSKTQLKVLKTIVPGEKVTADQIASRCDLSKSWASNLMKQLNIKFYLERIPQNRRVGGVEYVYMVKQGKHSYVASTCSN